MRERRPRRRPPLRLPAPRVPQVREHDRASLDLHEVALAIAQLDVDPEQALGALERRRAARDGLEPAVHRVRPRLPVQVLVRPRAVREAAVRQGHRLRIPVLVVEDELRVLDVLDRVPPFKLWHDVVPRPRPLLLAWVLLDERF